MTIPMIDLASHGRERDALLDRIVRLLEADARVGAAWLSGSFGRGEADEWSDLDLHVAVADEHFAAFLAERPALYRRVGRPILVQEEMPANSTPGGTFQLVLYTGAIDVDWNIGPVSMAARQVATQLLFDRVGVPTVAPPPLPPAERRARAEHWLTFFWAMAPIAVKYAGRGESRRAASQIDLMTTAFVALWRLIEQPSGPDPHAPNTNRPLEPELDARLPRLGWTIDPPAALAVIRALCAEVEQLHPALVALAVPIPAAMPGATAALGAIAEAVFREDDRDVRRRDR